MSRRPPGIEPPSVASSCEVEDHKKQRGADVVEVRAEVLPQFGVRAGSHAGSRNKVEHFYEASSRRRPHEKPRNEREADGEFAEPYKIRPENCVRVHYICEEGAVEGEGRELVGPILKAPFGCEPRPKNLVFPEEEEHHAGKDSANREDASEGLVGRHRAIITFPSFSCDERVRAGPAC